MLTDSTNKVVYNISTSTTPLADGYEITFTYFSPEYLKVYLQKDDGSESVIDATKYVIDEEDTTAAVIFVEGYVFPQGSTYLTIMREVPYSQPADYRNGEDMDAEEIEMSLDLLTAQTQQLLEMIDRTIQMPVSEDGVIRLPSKSARAGMLIGFNEDGDMVPVLTSDIEQKLQQALEAEENALGSANAAAGSAEKAEEFLDETKTAWQNALDSISQSLESALKSITTAKDQGVSDLNTLTDQLETRLSSIASHVETLVNKVKSSESNASYAANAAMQWANKSVEAAKVAQAVKNSCNKILGQIQSIQATIQSIQTDIQGRQDDIIERQEDVIQKQSDIQEMKDDVSGMKESVETDKGVVAADKAAVQTLKDQAIAAKDSAEDAVGEIQTLKGQITALAGSTTPGMTYALENRIMQRNFYVKNGRTYFYDTEAEIQDQEEST